jgi:hypothetical protein
MSDDLSTKIESLKSLLAELCPQRVVTRTFKDFAQRDKADLKRGIYTIVFQGIPGTGKLGGSPARVKLLLMGQFVAEEGAEGDVIEAGELAMISEITDLKRAAGERYPTIPTLEVLEVASSSQLDAPFGWVAAVLEMSWTKKCTT